MTDLMLGSNMDGGEGTFFYKCFVNNGESKLWAIAFFREVSQVDLLKPGMKHIADELSAGSI